MDQWRRDVAMLPSTNRITLWYGLSLVNDCCTTTLASSRWGAFQFRSPRTLINAANRSTTHPRTRESTSVSFNRRSRIQGNERNVRWTARDGCWGGDREKLYRGDLLWSDAKSKIRWTSPVTITFPFIDELPLFSRGVETNVGKFS